MSGEKPDFPYVDPRNPHWIVMCLSKMEEAPRKSKEWKHFFRHPTREAAEAEAQRLADLLPGRRFGVYASGRTFKTVPPEVVERVGEAAKALVLAGFALGLFATAACAQSVGGPVVTDPCSASPACDQPPVQVPEPATLGLFALGVAGLAVARRRARNG